jgi:hypothetical protein
MIMDKKNREQSIKEMTKRANEAFFHDLMKEETDSNKADLTNESAELKSLKEYVRQSLESIETHLPGEDE